MPFDFTESNVKYVTQSAFVPSSREPNGCNRLSGQDKEL